MRLFFALLLSVLVSGIAGSRASAQETRSPALEIAVSTYQYGKYRDALRAFEDLIYPVPLVKGRELKTARKYLGVCHYLLDERAKGESEFRRLLSDAPDESLDPVLFRPDIVHAFERIKRDLAEARASRGGYPGTVTGEARAGKSRWVASIPFGVGQFQNREYEKGLVLSGIQAGTLAAGLSLYYARCRFSNDGSCNVFTPENESTADSMWNVQLLFVYAFFISTGYGIIDSHYYFDKPADKNGGSAGTAFTFGLTPLKRGAAANFGIEF